MARLLTLTQPIEGMLFRRSRSHHTRAEPQVGQHLASEARLNLKRFAWISRVSAQGGG